MSSHFKPFSVGDAMIKGSQAAQQQVKAQEMTRMSQAGNDIRSLIAQNDGKITPDIAQQMNSIDPKQSMQLQQGQQKIDTNSLNYQMKALTWANKTLPTVSDQKTYGYWLDAAQKNGIIQKGQLPTKYDVDTQAQLKRMMIASDKKMSSIKPGINPTTGRAGFWRADETGKAQWIDGATPINKKGISVTTKDGTQINIGGTGQSKVMVNGQNEIVPNQMKVTSPERNKIQKSVREFNDNLYSLRQMKKLYKPEFQQVGSKIGFAWDSFRSKWFGDKLNPEEKAAYSKFVNFRATGGQLFSLTLKALSGVAVNPTEFKRAEGWIPYTGQSVWDGDDPTRMEEKIKRFTDYNEAAILRYKYALSRGIKMTQTANKRVLNKKTGQYIQKKVSELTASGKRFTNGIPILDQNGNPVSISVLQQSIGMRLEADIMKKYKGISKEEARDIAFEQLKDMIKK